MGDVAEEFYIIGKSSVGEGEWGRSGGIGRFILAYKVQDMERKTYFLAPKWPSLSLVPFKGPKKSQAPLKVSILCTGTI
jgi:hypothetical protein